MNHQTISEYIENLPLQKTFCKGYRPDEVYEVICNLSSMYNKFLSESYDENDILKKKVELLEKSERNHVDFTSIKDRNENIQKKSEVEVPKERQRAALSDKELQRLKRSELLEILLEQSKENEALTIRLKEERQRISELENQLNSREINIKKAGTIAEASFHLNGVYEAAERAAQQYLENLEALYEEEKNSFGRKEAEVETRCTALIQATQERCDFMKEDIMKNCEAMENDIKQKCDEMLNRAEKRSSDMLCVAEQKSKEMLSAAENRSKTLIDTAKTQRDEILSSIDAKCREREEAAEEKCRLLDLKAKNDVDKRWDELSKRLEAFYNAHEGLKELMTTSKIV